MELPFQIDRANHRGLVEQLVDGLRAAIDNGYYRAGTVLPTREELSAALKVSAKVPKTAFAHLVKEGYIVTRPRIGAVVMARSRPIWKGQILYVKPGDGGHYFSNVFESSFRAAMIEAGYSITAVTAFRGPRNSMDWSQLESVLRQRFDLVVFIGSRPKALKMIARSKQPAIVVWGPPFAGENCLGSVKAVYDGAFRNLTSWCVEKGIRTVTQVYFGHLGPDARSELGRAKLKVGDMKLRPNHSRYHSPESVQRAALDAFERLLSKGGCQHPDLYLFMDDYLCAGGVTALLHHGVRIPEDVRVASLANVGLGPVFPVPIALIENDPYAAGERLANAALKYFSTGLLPPSDFEVRFIPC